MTDIRKALEAPALVPIPEDQRAAATGERPIPVTIENLIAGKIPLAAYLAVQHMQAKRARSEIRAARKTVVQSETPPAHVGDVAGPRSGDNIRIGDLALRVQEVQEGGAIICCPLNPRRPDLISAAVDLTTRYCDPVRCGRDQFLIFPQKAIDAPSEA